MIQKSSKFSKKLPRDDLKDGSPPASLESEQAVLGAILVRPELLDKMADFLGVDDFYREAHRHIYQAMLDLFRKSEPVDLVTITGLLKDRGQLESVGGPVFLAGLSEQVGFATNAEHYAKVVHDKATLRLLLAASQDIASSCLSSNPDVSARELVEKAQSRIAEVLEGARFTKGKYISKRIRGYAENVEGNFELPRLYKDLGIFSESSQKAALMTLKRMVEEGVLAKVKPGVYRMITEEAPRLRLSDPMVDAEIDMRYPMGLERWFITYPKTVVLVAGEPDAGKTAMLLNTARLNFHLPTQYYWTSEMGLPELTGRVGNFDDYNADEWDSHVEFHERSTDFADMIKLYPNSIHYIDNLEMDDEFYKVGGLIDSIWKALKKGVAIIALHKDPGKPWALGGVGSAKRPRLYLSLEPKKDHSGNIMRVRKFKNWRDKVTNIKNKEFSFKLVKGCKIIYDDPPGLY